MLSRIRAASAAAREKGTLKSIETSYELLASNPPFLIRVLKNISEKKAAANNKDDSNGQRDPTGSAPPPTFNPFLPYDPSMYVQHLPPDHVLLLNKFNVVEDHTLIVTSTFQEQSSLLTPSDFAAMWVCLNDVCGLCFYNAGRIAGASQRHKHLQHVAAPLVPGGEGVTPFDEVVCTGNPGDGTPYASQKLRFLHAVVGTGDVAELAKQGETEEAGKSSMQRYMELLRIVGDVVDTEHMQEDTGLGEIQQPFCYNLVATREWMMVVPRRKECYEGISVNSLGFVGCLLVRDNVQLESVTRAGGMKVLEEVGFLIR